MSSHEPGRMIMISGASSSGKTSICRCLQPLLDEPFLHVSLDDFIEMLPPGRSDEALFLQMVDGFHRAVAGLLEAGNDLLVDHVLIEPEWLQQCIDLFKGRHVLFVGLDCPLEVLEEREKHRDVRRQGFARAQFNRIHAEKIYDIRVDTSVASPEACATAIAACFAQQTPTAFDTLRRRGRNVLNAAEPRRPDGAITVEECREGNVAAVLPLLRQLWPAAALDETRLQETLRQGLASPDHAYRVARVGGRVVGFASASFRENLWQAGPLAHIDELVVDAEFRNRGIGRQLIESLVQLAAARGCRRLELDTAFHRTDAHRFYERLGFTSRGLVFSRELAAP
jgi:chloramphenicol 3-O phosphotransferase